MNEIAVIHVDGKPHIQGLDELRPERCFPLDTLPTLINEGRLDSVDALTGAQLMQQYISCMDAEDSKSAAVVLRYFLVRDVLAYADERHGGAIWAFNGVTMPLDAEIIRTALVHQIEDTLQTVKTEATPAERVCQFYIHMKDWGKAGGGLSDMGQEVISDMFDSMLDGFVRNGCQLPTVH